MNFAAMMARLLKSRGQNVDSLMRAAEVDQSELEAAFKGEVSGQSVLGRLAPALGVHTTDLYILAGLDVPSDLAPCAPPADSILDHVVRTALRLPFVRREQLLGVARSMPRPDPVAPIVRERDPFPYGPGAVIVRMLRVRNLNNLNSAKMLYRLAGIGPLSAATIQVVGYGRKELTPELLSGFAAVLSFRVEDLAALLDIELMQASPPVDTATRQVAELIWDMRHLSSDQLRAIQEEFGVAA
ncbi:XRE family transcriptional regulator [Polymorphospora sp. NPDC050346]|uniref:XRE family transcriptional regulator n=1 Tax=Polymorphospora sp. NPDC050346 TaxID=3155780 RepID=UPI0033F6DC57